MGLSFLLLNSLRQTDPLKQDGPQASNQTSDNEGSPIIRG
ncbi:hypothetical protein AtDm6_0272 [Acetobacter tropicalis]|uniref:Uncharacterized protein n=1 Tax=Acetobacter tropicalis TaxID=104102 RepID=A0A094YWD8_9PROT|nr:hypothetical protein AtDm6_0272 [Acetobacter tropicalis]